MSTIVEKEEKKRGSLTNFKELAEEAFEAYWGGHFPNVDDPLKALVPAITDLELFLESTKTKYSKEDYKKLKDFLSGFKKRIEEITGK